MLFRKLKEKNNYERRVGLKIEEILTFGREVTLGDFTFQNVRVTYGSLRELLADPRKNFPFSRKNTYTLVSPTFPDILHSLSSSTN